MTLRLGFFMNPMLYFERVHPYFEMQVSILDFLPFNPFYPTMAHPGHPSILKSPNKLV